MAGETVRWGHAGIAGGGIIACALGLVLMGEAEVAWWVPLSLWAGLLACVIWTWWSALPALRHRREQRRSISRQMPLTIGKERRRAAELRPDLLALMRSFGQPSMEEALRMLRDLLGRRRDAGEGEIATLMEHQHYDPAARALSVANNALTKPTR
jgi:hypothetical protein